MTKNVQIDGSEITDWDSFHDVFSKTLGFPAFYGRNMDGWNDCMSSVDAPEDGLSTVHVAIGDVLVLHISGAIDLKRRCPEIYDALVECSAFVNCRRIKIGEQAVLALSFYE
jgi:RNAse (barnase) inhibitor barstar